ncbi:MAG: flagellar biosynthesis protein FlhA [Armatimonadetes bacterium]|nr:flagellar biosynthesis protein FlhA [Armatimonadota bacterium]
MGRTCARGVMRQLQQVLKHTDLLLGMGVLVVVAMLIMPLPDFVLDTGLVIALASSVVVLLTSVNVKDPLQFSVFPSMLLVTTLLRLALSVAATKLILGNGHAGNVIGTFGQFVLGGNFVVGFVSFLILMVVQFIVITNGSTRVSEVVARFTLDAMPGKQMAIDADLAAGLIDEEGARARRKQVKQEADFYGAMDGASKFVKGDAVASLLIIAINILGGFATGFMRGEGDPMAILSTYAMLSVGEGLVSQIPALLISTASGLLVTRAGQETGMAGTMFGQVLGQPRALATAGIAIGAFALVPGFPSLIFLTIGGLMFAVSRLATSNPGISKGLLTPVKEQAAKPVQPAVPVGPEAVLPLVNVDALEIEIGYGLTKLADTRVGGDLPDRVTATRRQIALEIGYVMPSVRIRDNAMLAPYEYVIKVRGEDVAKGEAQPDLLLAIDSGNVIQPVIGSPTKEPVFKLDAVWVEPQMREQAERCGYTVVEPTAMLATHLAEVVKTYSAELLSRQEVQQLLDTTKTNNDTVVNELQPAGVGVGDVQKVFQHLLREKVPIRDVVTILETMADFAGRVKDNEQMGELVRAAIARTITRQYLDDEGKLWCLTLDTATERMLQEALQQTAGGVILSVEPTLQQKLIQELQHQVEASTAQGHHAVVLCGTQIRLGLRKMLERAGVGVSIMAYNEVSAQAEVEFVGQVSAVAAAA